MWTYWTFTEEDATDEFVRLKFASTMSHSTCFDITDECAGYVESARRSYTWILRMKLEVGDGDEAATASFKGIEGALKDRKAVNGVD